MLSVGHKGMYVCGKLNPMNALLCELRKISLLQSAEVEQDERSEESEKLKHKYYTHFLTVWIHIAPCATLICNAITKLGNRSGVTRCATLLPCECYIKTLCTIEPVRCHCVWLQCPLFMQIREDSINSCIKTNNWHTASVFWKLTTCAPLLAARQFLILHTKLNS